MNRHLRRFRAIELRLVRSQRRKERRELEKELERLQKLLPKIIWVAKAPEYNYLRLKSYGTYCRRLHGKL